MRKVREVLRLRHALSLSYREIGEALGVGPTTRAEDRVIHAGTTARRLRAGDRRGQRLGVGWVIGIAEVTVTRGSLAISRYRNAQDRGSANGRSGKCRVGHLFQSAVLEARFANITATDS